MTSKVPPPPIKPPPPNAKPPRMSVMGRVTFVVLGLVAAAGSGLVLYYLFAPAFFVILVFGVIGVLHYLTWGWWLGPYLKSITPDQSEEDELAT